MFDLFAEPTDHFAIFITNDGYFIEGYEEQMFDTFHAALDFYDNYL